MPSFDTLITTYRLVDEYTARAARIVASTDAISKKMESAVLATGRFVAGLGAAAIGGLAAFGVESVKVAARFDSLKMGLNTVTGSAEETEKQMKRLRDLAKLPGLGFEEVINASIRLQSAGINAGLAERAIKGFGNALTSVGKGKAELDGVTLALSQIVSKGKVQAEEINQIAERVPQIRKIMIAAFGTADTEIIQQAGLTGEKFIDIITQHLERLPRAMGGAQNSFDNLSDNLKISMEKVGRVILTYVTPAVDKLSRYLENLNSSKAFDQFIQRVGVNFLRFVGVLGGALGMFQFSLAAVRFGMKDFAGAFASTVAGVAILAGTSEFIKKGAGILKGIKMGSGDDVDPLGDPADAVSGVAPESMNLQQEIARNTRTTAENTQKAIDFKRYALGGGDLGALGVSPIEMGQRRGGGGGANINVTAGRDALAQAMKGFAETVIQDLKRQGLLK